MDMCVVYILIFTFRKPKNRKKQKIQGEIHLIAVIGW